MNVIGAVIAGLVGTLAISLVMRMAPMMGLPKMDIVDMLSSMFTAHGNRILGWGLHFMMGVVFALVYTFLFSVGIGAPTATVGLVFGTVHWLVVGLVMLGVPMMHAGIRAGAASAPGAYMTNQRGPMAFVGGLVGHMVFGVIVALVYAGIR